MDNRDIELFAGIMRERQQELLYELEKQSMLSNGLIPHSGLKRRVLISLAATVVIVTVAILTGSQFI